MPLLNQQERQKIELKIAAVEKMTSAEFKVVIVKRAWLGIHKKAATVFKQHGLHKTKQRNAVLILVVEHDRELLIYGDVGIYQKTSTDHWPSVRNVMLDEFKRGEFYVGLSTGIELVAANLSSHFPAVLGENNNEISNDVVYS